MSRAWAAIVAYIQSFDPGMVRAVLLKLVRQALTGGSSLAMGWGWITNSQATQIIGAAAFLTGMLLSIWDAYTVRSKINAAVVVGRAEVGGTPEKKVAVATLKDQVKS